MDREIFTLLVFFLIIASLIGTPIYLKHKNRILPEEAKIEFSRIFKKDTSDIKIIRKTNSDAITGNPFEVSYRFSIGEDYYNAVCKKSGIHSDCLCVILKNTY